MNRTMINRSRNAAILAMALLTAGASAQPGVPVYQTTWHDAVTGDNAFWAPEGRFWDVDPGADRYQFDTYERPMTQEFKFVKGRYAAKEYFEYLDITQAKVGINDTYIFVRIDLYGRRHSTSGGDNIPVGMMERYGFRFSTNIHGRNGVLIVADQPEVKNEPNTKFGPIGVSGYRDTNADVGGADKDGPTGLKVTKSNNPDEESGMNGYDKVIIQDGRLANGKVVAWTRLDPQDKTVVELALNYKALGFTKNQMLALKYFDVEAIKGGPKDPQNYLWNDKYTKAEAGSPNPGANGKSEFGTIGLQNIYEADTLRVVGAQKPGDFDGDDQTTLSDYPGFAAAFNAASPEADIDGDGEVNAIDLIAFLDASR